MGSGELKSNEWDVLGDSGRTISWASRSISDVVIGRWGVGAWICEEFEGSPTFVKSPGAVGGKGGGSIGFELLAREEARVTGLENG